MRTSFITIICLLLLPLFSMANAVEKLTVFVYANPGFIVKGDTTTLIATASIDSPDIKYEWSPTDNLVDPYNSITYANPKTTTTYTLTVTYGSQVVSESVEVKVLENPRELNLTLDGNDVSLNWTHVEYATCYRVRRNDETIVNYTTDTAFVDKDVPNGNYCYRVIAVRNAFISPESEHACVDIEFEENEETSLDINVKDNVMLYPNPVRYKIHVKADYIDEITIVNMMGQVVMKVDVDSEAMMLDMNHLDSGLYLMHIDMGKDVVTRKINLIK